MTKRFITNNGRRIVLFSACFLFASWAIQSCKKKDLVNGSSTLNPDLLLASGGQEFALETFTVKEDSFPTDNQLNALLGNMHDPKMGTVKASFFTQFDCQSKISQPAGTVYSIDSVVLSLYYSGYYGNLDPQTFEVYEMQESIHVDSTYYKFTNKQVYPTNLIEPSSATQTPNPTDSVVVGGEKRGAQLRLRLNPTLGNTLINEALNGTAYATTTAFQNFFKGLKVAVNPAPMAANKGGIFYFNLGSSETKLTIFYHVASDTTLYNFDLVVNNKCGDFNQVTVDNTGYPVESLYSNPALGSTQYYAQAFQSRAKVDFTSINAIPKGSIIHAAVLELPVAYQTGTRFYPSVYLNGIVETDELNGAYATTYDNSRKSYLFDLREYVQNIVLGKTSNGGLYLNPSLFTSTAERIIFNGVNSPYKMKPRLVIKYTTF